MEICIGRKIDENRIVHNGLGAGPDILSSSALALLHASHGTEHGRPSFCGGRAQIFNFHINLLSHSAFDRACGQALNDVFLSKYIDHHHRQHGQQK